MGSRRLFSIAQLCLGLLLFGSAGIAATNQELIVGGRVDDALQQLNAQIQSSPNNAEAYHLLSKANFHLQKWDEAISFGERAVALAPNNSIYWMWLGRIYGQKADSVNFVSAAGLVKKVRNAFEKSVSLDANNVEAKTDLAEFYLEAPGFMGGGTDKARDEATRIAPLDQARAHWVQARLAEKKDDPAGAEREYMAAIQTSGNSGTYWLNLASFYRHQKRWTDMDSAIQKAMVSAKPSNVPYDAATLLYSAGRNLPDAANLVRKYLSAASPSDEAPTFQAHYMLGAILEKVGDKQGAASAYRASLSLASGYKPAQEGLRRVTSS